MAAVSPVPTVQASAPVAAVAVPARAPSVWRLFWRRCVANWATLAALGFTLLLFLVVAIGPLLTPVDPLAQDPLLRGQAPGAKYWFGTDHVGRDIFSRVIHGARLSLSIGGAAVLLGLTLGVAIGLVAGYLGGLVDEVLMRFIDVLLAFPGILLAILVVSILGPGLWNVIVALAIFSVPTFARITRSAVLTIKNLDYVLAARAIGGSAGRIMLGHVLPNALAPIIIYATLRLATAILGGATLSFLGLGVAPPAPEWGLMVSQSRHYIRSEPYMILFPGLAIFLTVLSLNLLGDAIRDVVDPKSRMARA